MQADVWNILDSCAFFSQIHPNGKIATVSDIEHLKNDPAVQDKFNQVIEVIYEKFTSLKSTLSDFF